MLQSVFTRHACSPTSVECKRSLWIFLDWVTLDSLNSNTIFPQGSLEIRVPSAQQRSPENHYANAAITWVVEFNFVPSKAKSMVLVSLWRVQAKVAPSAERSLHSTKVRLDRSQRASARDAPCMKHKIEITVITIGVHAEDCMFAPPLMGSAKSATPGISLSFLDSALPVSWPPILCRMWPGVLKLFTP